MYSQKQTGKWRVTRGRDSQILFSHNIFNPILYDAIDCCIDVCVQQTFVTEWLTCWGCRAWHPQTLPVCHRHQQHSGQSWSCAGQSGEIWGATERSCQSPVGRCCGSHGPCDVWTGDSWRKSCAWTCPAHCTSHTPQATPHTQLVTLSHGHIAFVSFDY